MENYQVVVLALSCFMTAVHCLLVESVTMDYRSLSYADNTILIEGRYSGSCNYLQVHTFMESDLRRGDAQVHYYSDPVPRDLQLRIPKEQLVNATISDRILLRIVAIDDVGTICSNVLSQQTFYYFVTTGMQSIRLQEAQPGPLEIQVPTTHCRYPIILWPRREVVDEGNCHCLPLRSTFDDCVRQCQSDYDITLSTNNSIHFNNLHAHTNFMIHFLCDNDPCGAVHSCFTETVVASYRIEGIHTLYLSTIGTAGPPVTTNNSTEGSQAATYKLQLCVMYICIYISVLCF